MKYCLGTVQFGLTYGIQGNGQPEKQKVFEMLSRAIASGIDVLDTAAAYGEAEQVLGDFFRAYPEQKECAGVVSKLKPDAFQSVPQAEWAAVAAENARASLDRLGIEKLEAYLFHNASYIYDKEAVKALRFVREAGLAKRIGVSIYTPEEAMKALEYKEIEAIQIPYNAFDHRLDHCGFFRKAKDRGVLVFARSSLLQGLLMMNPEKLPEKVSFARPYIEKYLELCGKHRVSPLEAAVGYVGNKREIDYVVFGVDNEIQLEQYIKLADFELPEKMKQELETAFDTVEERLVNPVLWK